MEGTVVADEVGITFHFKALNHPEKLNGSGQTIRWQEIASVTYTRVGRLSTGYLRVNRVGDGPVPKPRKDPQGLTANVGSQADQMKLFADQVAERLRVRSGATPVTEKAGIQKQGVKDARGQMTVKLGARRELRKLKGFLLPGEQVRYLASGVVDRKQGLVALTDRRLLMLFHGHLRQSLADIPLDRVTAVRDKAGMVMGTLIVVASNTEMVISQVPKQDMRNLAQALRTRMSAGSLPQLPAVDLGDEADPALDARDQSMDSVTSTPDRIEQLERLAALRDQGVITDEEFQTAKERLLGSL